MPIQNLFIFKAC